jgi:hypothetical protein
MEQVLSSWPGGTVENKASGLVYSLPLQNEYAVQVLFHRDGQRATIKDNSDVGCFKIPFSLEVVEVSRVHGTIATIAEWVRRRKKTGGKKKFRFSLSLRLSLFVVGSDYFVLWKRRRSFPQLAKTPTAVQTFFCKKVFGGFCLYGASSLLEEWSFHALIYSLAVEQLLTTQKKLQPCWEKSRACLKCWRHGLGHATLCGSSLQDSKKHKQQEHLF